MQNTPSYIKALLKPTTKPEQGRKVWSIDLVATWLPFFTATNTMGDTAIPSDALGAPLRLAYNKDGSVKFSRNGRPTTRVVKSIGDSVRLVRENFVATLQQYTSDVVASHQEDYAIQIELAQEAGKPIMAKERADIDKAIQLQIEEAMREAQSHKPEEATKPEGELVTA